MKILIFSEEIDRSSDIVCAWLNYFSQKYIRCNTEELQNPILEILESSIKSSVLIKLNGRKLNIEKVHTVWFRRGLLNIYSPVVLPESLKDVGVHLENEGNTIQQYIYALLTSKNHINHPNVYNFNKLLALRYATSVGLKIPNTIVCQNSNKIKSFIMSAKDCICKTIQDIASFTSGSVESSIGKIEQVKTEDITESSYWYSLFQEGIRKKYEIRVFYFLNKIYSMAIFPKFNSKNIIDSQEISLGNHSNRMVPYKLPYDIAVKIRKLMKKIKLESGSIDLLVDDHNNYYFLEVNPVGQFNFVSEICNYYIERDIAKYLEL